METNNFHANCEIPTTISMKWQSFWYADHGHGWFVAPACHWGDRMDDQAHRAWEEQCRALDFDLAKYDWANPTAHNPRVMAHKSGGRIFLLVHPKRETMLRKLAKRIYVENNCMWEEPYLNKMTDYWESIPEAQRLRFYSQWGIEPSDTYGLDCLPAGEAVDLLTVWNWLRCNNPKFEEKVQNVW